jgi:RNA polymerase sigma-70 factor (ECF subfamily)
MPETEERLVERWRGGDKQALGELFALHRTRLERHVRFRMDRRLAGRLDPDDILQEAYLAAAQRAGHYLANPRHSVFVWLRMVVGQTLIDLHREHLGARMRDAGREVPLQGPRGLPATSAMVMQLVGSLTSPSQAVMRAEMASQLERALANMNPTDQEILALRHFEELSNSEVAEVLELDPKAASIRYVRALRRLKEILAEIPDLGEPSHRDGQNPPGPAPRK